LTKEGKWSRIFGWGEESQRETTGDKMQTRRQDRGHGNRRTAGQFIIHSESSEGNNGCLLPLKVNNFPWVKKAAKDAGLEVVVRGQKMRIHPQTLQKAPDKFLVVLRQGTDQDAYATMAEMVWPKEETETEV